ncbi:MAG TPA: hypothetical protein VF789_23810 [Thermoanaerobaculia bacterium]
MDVAAEKNFDVRQERFGLQAQFLAPVFNLFQDLPSFSRQIFSALGPHYGLRLTDLRFETGSGSLGDVCLRLSWPSLAEARIFLDRVELDSSYLQFLGFENRDLVADVLSTIAEYVGDVKFRAYSVTQEAHGALVGQSRKDFFAQFVSVVPEGLGPALGAGLAFYFGSEDERLASSVTLDFSRTVDGGVFVQYVTLYDASKMPPRKIQESARSEFKTICGRIGLSR